MITPSDYWPNLAKLNENSKTIADATLRDSTRFQVTQLLHAAGSASVLDFAIGRTGTLAAGIELARICLAGLADVQLVDSHLADFSQPSVQVSTDSPVEACIGSQYAGWEISDSDYFALGSGPARVLRGKEDVLKTYGLIHSQTPGAAVPAVVVLESNQAPDQTVIEKIAHECGVPLNNLTVCVARTASLPGGVQVVARSVEVALHKLHELNFDLTCIKKATGFAPLPPVASDDVTALGWTNDAIMYGGDVSLWVDTDDEGLSEISQQLPSCRSKEFGIPFLTLFKKYDMNFYLMDKLLFSPAAVTINNLRTGSVFRNGETRTDILKLSFGME